MKTLRKYSISDLTSEDIGNVFVAQWGSQPPFRVTELQPYSQEISIPLLHTPSIAQHNYSILFRHVLTSKLHSTGVSDGEWGHQKHHCVCGRAEEMNVQTLWLSTAGCKGCVSLLPGSCQTTATTEVLSCISGI